MGIKKDKEETPSFGDVTSLINEVLVLGTWKGTKYQMKRIHASECMLY